MSDSRALFAKAEALRLQAEAAQAKEQAECPHPISEIVEGEYRPGAWLGAQPPFRVCKACGYAEEGWYCGYWLLRGDPRMRDDGIVQMDRDGAHRFVRTFVDNETLAKRRLGR